MNGSPFSTQVFPDEAVLLHKNLSTKDLSTKKIKKAVKN